MHSRSGGVCCEARSKSAGGACVMSLDDTNGGRREGIAKAAGHVFGLAWGRGGVKTPNSQTFFLRTRKMVSTNSQYLKR